MPVVLYDRVSHKGPAKNDKAEEIQNRADDYGENTKIGGEESERDDYEEDAGAVGFEAGERVGGGAGKDSERDLEAVERRYGQQVEYGEKQVPEHQLFEGEGQNGVGSVSGYRKAARPGFDEAGPDRDRECYRGDDVGDWPGERDCGHSRAVADSEVHGIDWGGLAPAESGEEYEYGAERVEMGEGVEGEASLGAGGVVAEAGGGVGVAEFVEGYGDYEGQGEGRERYEREGGVGLK